MTTEELHTLGETRYGKEWRAKLARYLGVNPRTVRKWASGQAPVPEWAAEKMEGQAWDS